MTELKFETSKCKWDDGIWLCLKISKGYEHAAQSFVFRMKDKPLHRTDQGIQKEKKFGRQRILLEADREYCRRAAYQQGRGVPLDAETLRAGRHGQLGSASG